MGRIAITGASGFVGRTLIRALLGSLPAEELRALVRDERRAAAVLPPGLEVRLVDVSRPETLTGAFDGCDAVVHTVAIPTERRGSFARVNVDGTRNVVSEAERAHVRRLVHVSAVGADAASPFPFLRSKGEGERAALAASCEVVALRPSILFGPGDDFFPRLGFTLRFPVVPVPGDGGALFQPLHVEDLASAIARALRTPAIAGAHDVAGPDVVTYDELLDEAMRGYGRRRPTLHVPVWLMRPAARVMELVLPDPPVTAQQLDMLAIDNVAAPNAIEQVFGVRPRAFRGGLAYLRAG